MIPTHVFGVSSQSSRERADIAAGLYAKAAWVRRRLLIGNDCARQLYKYFSFDLNNDDQIRNVREVLVNSTLWFSKPSSFNDPFDFRCDVHFTPDVVALRKYFEKSAKKEARRHGGTKSSIKKTAHKLVQAATARQIADPDLANNSFLQIRDSHGVCCFTSQPKSLLMWAHYGNSNSGLCFQFDVAADFELFALARRVSYEEEFPTLEWPTDQSTVVDRVIFRKYKVWAYEEERRIVYSSIAEQGRKFSPTALKGIICGHRMTPSAYDLLRTMLVDRRLLGYPDVRIYKCIPRPHSYKMRVERDRGDGGS